MPPMTRSRSTCSFLATAIALIFTTSVTQAQLKHVGPTKSITQAATLPPYDVISIKQHDSTHDSPNEQTSNMSIGDNVLRATNVPLFMLIEFAYDVKEDMISGLTGPVSSAHFDIEAKVLAADGGKPPKLTDSQLQVMIIPLLADRFHLKVHVQQKTLPVYDLVVQKGGPKIKLSPEEQKDNSWNLNGSNNDKVLTAKGASMTDLAQALADEVHRQVIDKTGLAGSADITLKWSDDVAMELGGTNVISIFTAVEEQLGLKLQSSKGPVETLVIDHAEMPSAD
jgi:uncharacterized protein (TIGR03435 family)